MSTIPSTFHDLFEKATIAHFVTMLPNGTPHVTPVCIGYDTGADRLLVNTERGRRKERNVVNDPTVAVSMTDPDDPFRYLSVTGEVEEITTEGAREHADKLVQRYWSQEEYSNPIHTERVILRIRPDDVITSG